MGTRRRYLFVFSLDHYFSRPKPTEHNAQNRREGAKGACAKFHRNVDLIKSVQKNNRVDLHGKERKKDDEKALRFASQQAGKLGKKRVPRRPTMIFCNFLNDFLVFRTFSWIFLFTISQRTAGRQMPCAPERT